MINNSTVERNRIFIFNLETDLDSHVLAAAHDWVEAFSQFYKNVEVYSTHVGRLELGSNVTVSELGGGSFFSRLKNLMRQIMVLEKLWKFRKSAVVFHHMSSRTLALLGFPIRLMGIPQGVWYSHSKADFGLKIGSKFADVIFSSTLDAVPITGKRMAFLGHGIKIPEQNSEGREHEARLRTGIVSLGRISRVKNIEELLFAINRFQLPTTSVTLIGPESDPIYSAELQNLATEFNISLILEGPKPHSEINGELKRFKYIFSGTPLSVDKALLEGALAGCFAITSNTEGIRLSGMDEVWKSLGFNYFPSIEDQVSTLDKIEEELDFKLRKRLIQACRTQNDLAQTVQKIKNILSESESRIGA
jgi:glycosyltransferase involved in cell wall biosynthesis